MRDLCWAQCTQWTAHHREEPGHALVSPCYASSTGAAHRLPKKTPGHCGQYCETSVYWPCHIHRYQWYRPQDYNESRPPRLVPHHADLRSQVFPDVATVSTPPLLVKTYSKPEPT